MCLLPPARQVVTIARSLGRLQRDHGLPIDPEENIKLNLNFGLVDVVYEWARGVPFCEITQVFPLRFVHTRACLYLPCRARMVGQQRPRTVLVHQEKCVCT